MSVYGWMVGQWKVARPMHQKVAVNMAEERGSSRFPKEAHRLGEGASLVAST